MTAKAWRYLTLLLGARQEEEPARLTVHQLRKEKEGLLAPTNVTSDDARRRQFGVAVFHDAVAFYPGVYRGVIYISAGKAVNEEID